MTLQNKNLKYNPLEFEPALGWLVVPSASSRFLLFYTMTTAQKWKEQAVNQQLNFVTHPLTTHPLIYTQFPFIKYPWHAHVKTFRV